MAQRTLPSRWWPIFFGVIAIALWLAWAWYVMDRFPETSTVTDERQKAVALRGQFGDMFGGITALFTALILAGTVYTLWLHCKELENMKNQQIESEQSNSRTALLMAKAALINAKSGLLQSRYQFLKDFGQGFERCQDDISRLKLQMCMKGLGENIGKDMEELESLAKELSLLIKDIRDHTTINTVNKNI